MIRALAVAVVLVASTAGFAAPPMVDVPAETKATSDYVTIVPKTDAKAVSYVGLSGVDPFPSGLLKDSKTFVLPTRGLPVGRYSFAGVASLNDEHTTFRFVVVVGTPPVIPDPKIPPPVDPPPPPATSYYFLVVRADGPAAPAFTAAMGLPAWAELRAKGHQFKDKTVTDAKKLNLELPAGTVLPCVVTLTTTGGVSKIARGPVPLPTTDDGIRKLAEGVK